MTNMKFSKAHEREEARLLRKGHVRSWIGLALCWLPLVGVLFAAGGFIRCMVRVTRKHRRRRAACLVFAAIALAAAIGVNMAELWAYSRDPELPSRIGRQVWAFIVGENAPEDTTVSTGTEYTDMDTAGLGVTDDIVEEDDISGWDDGVDWGTLDGSSTLPEGDGWIDAADADWGDDGVLWGDGTGDDGLDWGDETGDDGFVWDDGDGFFGEDEADDGLEWGDGDDLLGDVEEARPDSLNVGKGETILPLDD